MNRIKPAHLLMLVLSLSLLLILTAPTQHAGATDGNSAVFNSLLGFTSCDKNGIEKHIFQESDDVYAKGGWFPLRIHKQVSIYVMPNGLKIKDIKPANAVSGPANTTVDSKGHLPVTEIWPHNLKAGQYDVWIDVNRNGKFDNGDLLHFYFYTCFYLFFVVPEYIVGSIGAVAAMLCGLAVFKLKSTTKTRRSHWKKRSTTL